MTLWGAGESSLKKCRSLDFALEGAWLEMTNNNPAVALRRLFVTEEDCGSRSF